MKNITKIIIALATIIIVLIIAMVLLNHRGSQNSAKSGFSSGTSRVSNTSKSSMKRSSSKSSSSSSEQASSDTVTENSNVAEAVTPSSALSVPANGSATTVTPSPDSGNTIAQTQGGCTEVTSGTLTLDKDTPVYAETDKNSPVVFMMDPGEVNWDQYVDGNGDSWYSFVIPGENGDTRYYIAYSDVGH